MAQGSREPNTALAQAIQEAGLSRNGLAARVRQVSARHGAPVKAGHQSVSRWLAGTPPHAATARYIAEVLSERLGRALTPCDLGLPTSLDDAMTFSPGEYHTDLQGAVEAMAALVVADSAQSPKVSECVDQALWNSAAMAWLFNETDAEARVSKHARRIGAAEIAQVETTAAAFMALDFQLGGGGSQLMLCRYFQHDVLPLLHDVRDDANGRALLSAAASVTQLLGWTAYDLGWHQRAQQYMTQGLRMAQQAQDHMLGARFLANMSHQANYLGRFNQARQLARAAQERAQVASPSVRAMLLAMEARACAGAGDSRGAGRALDHAERALENAHLGDEPAWISYFDASELAGEAAHCFRDLKQPRSAQPFILRALELTPATCTRTKAFIQLVNAASCLHTRNVDQACDFTLSALNDGVGLKSARYARYVRDVVSDFAPYKGSVSVDIALREAAGL